MMYVFSDTASCSFSEATLGKISALLESGKTLLLYTPDIRHCSVLGRWEMSPKIEWVAPSIIFFFTTGTPSYAIALVSLKSTGPYQRNSASLVFIRCVVLETQLFFIHLLQKFKFSVTRKMLNHPGASLSE